MARPKKNLPPARTHRITVRLTDEMFDVVTRDAKAANLSNAEYIRQLILKRTIKYAPTIVHDDTKIIQELGAHGQDWKQPQSDCPLLKSGWQHDQSPGKGTPRNPAASHRLLQHTESES